MNLTREEQSLINNFRKLPPSLRDELLTSSAALLHRVSAGVQDGTESGQGQCLLKGREARPEAEKTPIFTE